jgi:dihydroorotate dehydrogenase (fumarate)
MVDLSTRYMGLELKNPLVVSSSSLTKTLQGVKKVAAAGAGAIVLKSLFEEQIAADVAELARFAEIAGHTESVEYLQGYGEALGPREYLKLVSDAKQAVEVPIIASINCRTEQRWAQYARQLAAAGADALEINVGILPSRARMTGAEVEESHERILHAVQAQVDLPVAMKVGPYVSSFAHLASRLGNDHIFAAGSRSPSEVPEWGHKRADALVLFNRFYHFDIDVEELRLTGGNPYSTSAELHLPLRWISLLAGRVDCDLAATTGVHDGRDMVKLLLAGATTVQVCSTLYRNGIGRIGRMLQELEAWMQAHGFTRLPEFRGRLSQVRSEHPEEFERLQYIKALVGLG